MASLQQAVSGILLNNYMSVAVITAITYDYILTFSNEIEYIWIKPWTWVSILFVFARYFGLSFAISFSIWGSSFLPGPAKMYVFIFESADIFFQVIHHLFIDSHVLGNVILLFGEWCSWVFICTADLIMVLRLWALYNQSKLILGLLLTFYVAECITFLTSFIMVTVLLSHNNSVVVTAQVLQFSFCMLENPPLLQLNKATYVLQIVLGALMCLLTMLRFVKEMLEMYKAKKQLKLNPYMARLAWDGMTYFMVILIYAVITILISAGDVSLDGWQAILVLPLQLAAPFILVPRFVLSLRELYARDIQGGLRNRIDTAFGLGSAFGSDATASTIMFADIEDHEGKMQGVYEIQIGEGAEDNRYTSGSINVVPVSALV